jgi:hypothetical protein
MIYTAPYVMYLSVQIHYEDKWEGVGPWKIETFLGPEMATSEASAIWAQKSLDERSP